jgi:hypothetical protein
VSVFIGEMPQRDTDVEEEVIFEQQCGIKNNDAYVMKFEVECDFDKITGERSLFMGTETVNFPLSLDTQGSSSGGLDVGRSGAQIGHLAARFTTNC